MILQYCLSVIGASILICLTLIIVGVIAYLTMGVVVSLIDTFKEVRVRQKANRLLKAMNALAKAAESSTDKK